MRPRGLSLLLLVTGFCLASQLYGAAAQLEPDDVQAARPGILERIRMRIAERLERLGSKETGKHRWRFGFPSVAPQAETASNVPNAVQYVNPMVSGETAGAAVTAAPPVLPKDGPALPAPVLVASKEHRRQEEHQEAAQEQIDESSVAVRSLGAQRSLGAASLNVDKAKRARTRQRAVVRIVTKEKQVNADGQVEEVSRNQEFSKEQKAQLQKETQIRADENGYYEKHLRSAKKEDKSSVVQDEERSKYTLVNARRKRSTPREFVYVAKPTRSRFTYVREVQEVPKPTPPPPPPPPPTTEKPEEPPVVTTPQPPVLHIIREDRTKTKVTTEHEENYSSEETITTTHHMGRPRQVKARPARPARPATSTVVTQTFPPQIVPVHPRNHPLQQIPRGSGITKNLYHHPKPYHYGSHVKIVHQAPVRVYQKVHHYPVSVAPRYLVEERYPFHYYSSPVANNDIIYFDDSPQFEYANNLILPVEAHNVQPIVYSLLDINPSIGVTDVPATTAPLNINYWLQ